MYAINEIAVKPEKNILDEIWTRYLHVACVMFQLTEIPKASYVLQAVNCEIKYSVKWINERTMNVW